MEDCSNGCFSGEVSVSVKCPECLGPADITLHDRRLTMYKLLRGWSMTLYYHEDKSKWTMAQKKKLSSLAFHTGRVIGEVWKGKKRKKSR